MGTLGGHGSEDIGDGFHLDGHVQLILLNFEGRAQLGAIIHDGGGHDKDIAMREAVPDGFEHIVAGDDVFDGDAVGGWQGDGAADQFDDPADFGSGLGEGVAHFAGGGVAEEADGVKKLAGGAG